MRFFAPQGRLIVPIHVKQCLFVFFFSTRLIVPIHVKLWMSFCVFLSRAPVCFTVFVVFFNVFFTGRMPRSLLTGQKWGFTPQGRLVVPIHVKLGTWVCLAVQNFTSIGAGGGNVAQNIKNFHFLVKSHDSLNRFLKFLGAFIRLPIYTSISNVTWFALQVMELLLRIVRRSIRPNFSVHPVEKKLCIGSQNGCTFLMGATSSITMQSLGKIVQWSPAVGVKMWCLFLFFVCFFLSCSESGVPCVRGVHISNKHCVANYRPILTMFSAFFSGGTALSDPLHCSHFYHQVEPQFSRNCHQKLQKV